MEELAFYRGRRVLVTGHTGFKGSWLCALLLRAGAEVTGYSLEPPTEPNLFTLAGLADKMKDIRGDVTDYEKLKSTFDEARPEVVFHLAAQPIVRESYRSPRQTYAVNVMGTVNVLECVRSCSGVKSAVIVTTDKVYENRELARPFREEERLDGFDPYSNSKSCAELAAHSYVRSFFGDGPAVSTVRAGNVIGGGDFAPDRILPDCVRAVQAGRAVRLRNPRSVRPFQHVLEPLFGYLLIAARQFETPALAGCYNIGPEQDDCLTVGQMAELFCRCWGDGARWESCAEPNAPHEAGVLRLDCTKMKTTFGWRPRWDAAKAVEMTVQFTRNWLAGGDILAEMYREMDAYLSH